MQNYLDADPNCFPKGLKNICTSPYEYRIERYTPYYLTTGKPRPAIISAPSELTFNSSFLIEIKTSTGIDKATLIRYSTTTHYTNTDQRYVELDVIGLSDSKVGLRMPANGAIAPPGNWMLFVLKEGVPSVAKTIRLQDGPQQDIPEADMKSLRPLKNSAKDIKMERSLWITIFSLCMLTWMF